MALVNYATEYNAALAQAFPYVLNFGALYATPNNGRYRWVNSKTIEIPVISTTGRKDANRDAIGAMGRNWDNSWETKVLSNERQWDTLVHPMDIEQTNMVASISNITRVFNEEQKFPEMDAYLVSKVYADYIAAGGTPVTTVPDVDNILELFDSMMENMDEARVPPNGRILYATPEIRKILKNAAKIQRNIDVGTEGSTVNRAVNRLDEVEIVNVPSVLMGTVFDFSTGWAPGVGTKAIRMFLVHPLAVITPTTYDFASLDDPSATTQGKYAYYEESHEDVFILNNKKGAIEFNVEA